MNKVNHIIIVESSHLLYEGLVQVISKSGLNAHIRQTASLGDAEKQISIKPDSIVIINPSLVQYNTKEFHHLKNAWDGVKWIGLVYLHFDYQVLDLFDGIISISDTPSVIVSTLKRVLLSESKIPDVTEDVLSDRETEVLKLLAKGMSNKEIGDELNISVNTVITHRKKISQKTGIKTVSGLTIYAVVNKLIIL